MFFAKRAKLNYINMCSCANSVFLQITLFVRIRFIFTSLNSSTKLSNHSLIQMDPCLKVRKPSFYSLFTPLTCLKKVEVGWSSF